MKTITSASIRIIRFAIAFLSFLHRSTSFGRRFGSDRLDRSCDHPPPSARYSCTIDASSCCAEPREVELALKELRCASSTGR